MWFLLFALAVFGQDVPVGSLVIETSPDATMRLFDRVNPDRIELAVYENRKPLSDQLKYQQTDHIADAWAVSTGSGTWFVTLYVSDPRVDARIEKQGARHIIRTNLRPNEVPIAPKSVATVDELLSGDVPRIPARPAAIPLRPVWGDSWYVRLDPRSVRMPLPTWKPEYPDLPPGPPSLDRIDALRKLRAMEKDRDRRDILLQLMALDYQALGLHQEARTYFDQLAFGFSRAPQVSLLLHQADAALATGQWETAHRRCKEAHEAGADTASTLVCIGSVALATGSPAPGATADSLIATAPGPGGSLIASQLYFLDNRYADARSALARISTWPRQLERWKDATAGDIAIAQRDLDAARSHWAKVGNRGILGALAEHRMRLIRLNKASPSEWAMELPGISRTIRRRRWTAAEGHYMGAQIGEVLNEYGLAAEHLTALVDKHPEILKSSDVLPRLLSTCDTRLRLLHRADRTGDLVAFHNECWRDELQAIVVDPTLLEIVAEAYEKLGLWERGLSVQRDAVAAYVREDQENGPALTRLARLYLRTKRAPEALETTAYARRRADVSAVRAELLLIDGQAHLSLGNLEKALASWRSVPSNSPLKSEANIQTAMSLASAGRCAQASPMLTAWLDRSSAQPSELVEPEEAQLALARCAIANNRPKSAIEFATQVGESETWRPQASWIASSAASKDLALTPPSEPLEPSPLWDELLKLQRESEAVHAGADKYRK